MTVSDAPTVSVVIPVHNAAPFIKEAIDSVLAQSVRANQVIVIDDGSTDATPDVLRTFGDRIQWSSKRYGSAAASRNAGAAMADGTWLAFLDADDAWLPQKLERQLALTGDGNVGMVYSDRFNVGTRGDLPEVQSRIQPLYSGDVFLDLLLLGNYITLSSVLVRTALFRALGGFSETLRNAEDWELWIRMSESHRVAVCPEPLVRYRFHDAMKSSDPARMQTARRTIMHRALQSPRGARLSVATRRRILGSTARANGSDAARRGATWMAWQEFVRSLVAWPFDPAVYRDVARFVLGRTGR
jgi:glycosyltransferase involved in cell wall biosynthesis